MNLNKILGTIIAICAFLILVSVFGPEVPPPDSWLQAWTALVATVVGIVVAVSGLLLGGRAFRTYVDRGKNTQG